jgi:hypothetical protein
MNKSLIDSLILLVEEQLEKDLANEQKAEFSQLLKVLNNERENPSVTGTKKILLSLLKHFATHRIIELVKQLL